MDEPVYEYVKGQGWVVLTIPQHTFEVDGYIVTIINRKPAVGEKYWGLSGSDWITDRRPNFQRLEGYVRSNRHILLDWPEVDIWESHNKHFGDAVYCVIEIKPR
jgi:hypothetical protein